MKKVTRKMKQAIVWLHMRSTMLKSRCTEILDSNAGDGHLVAVLGVAIVVLVVVATVFQPQIMEMFSGSMDNASSYMDDITNYKG